MSYGDLFALACGATLVYTLAVLFLSALCGMNSRHIRPRR